MGEMKSKESALKKEFEMEKQTWELERQVAREEAEARHLQQVSQVEGIWQSKVQDQVAVAKELALKEATEAHAEQTKALELQWMSEKEKVCVHGFICESTSIPRNPSIRTIGMVCMYVQEIKERVGQERQEYEARIASLQEKNESALEGKVLEQEAIQEKLKLELENEIQNLKSAHEHAVKDLGCSWQNRLDEVGLEISKKKGIERLGCYTCVLTRFSCRLKGFTRRWSRNCKPKGMRLWIVSKSNTRLKYPRL